jgi:hypothetical protein
VLPATSPASAAASPLHLLSPDLLPLPLFLPSSGQIRMGRQRDRKLHFDQSRCLFAAGNDLPTRGELATTRDLCSPTLVQHTLCPETSKPILQRFSPLPLTRTCTLSHSFPHFIPCLADNAPHRHQHQPPQELRAHGHCLRLLRIRLHVRPVSGSGRRATWPMRGVVREDWTPSIGPARSGSA